MSDSSSESEKEWKTVREFTKHRIHPEDLQSLLEAYQQNGSGNPAANQIDAKRSIGLSVQQAVMEDELLGSNRSSRELVMAAAKDVMKSRPDFLEKVGAQLEENARNRERGVHPDDYQVLLDAQIERYRRNGSEDLAADRAFAEELIAPHVDRVMREHELTGGRSSRELVMAAAKDVMGQDSKLLAQVDAQLTVNEKRRNGEITEDAAKTAAVAIGRELAAGLGATTTAFPSADIASGLAGPDVVPSDTTKRMTPASPREIEAGLAGAAKEQPATTKNTPAATPAEIARGLAGLGATHEGTAERAVPSSNRGERNPFENQL